MSKVEIKRAERAKYGRAVCPHCEDAQEDMIDRDTEQGSYECDSCSRIFIIDHNLISGRYDYESSTQLRNDFEDLEERIKRLEKELGIK